MRAVRRSYANDSAERVIIARSPQNRVARSERIRYLAHSSQRVEVLAFRSVEACGLVVAGFGLASQPVVESFGLVEAVAIKILIARSSDDSRRVVVSESRLISEAADVDCFDELSRAIKQVIVVTARNHPIFIFGIDGSAQIIVILRIGSVKQRIGIQCWKSITEFPGRKKFCRRRVRPRFSVGRAETIRVIKQGRIAASIYRPDNIARHIILLKYADPVARRVEPYSCRGQVASRLIADTESRVVSADAGTVGYQSMALACVVFVVLEFGATRFCFLSVCRIDRIEELLRGQRAEMDVGVGRIV